MSNLTRFLLLFLVALALLLGGCRPAPTPQPAPTATIQPQSQPVPTPTPLFQDGEQQPPAAEPTPETGVMPSGPDSYPAGYNPLTGFPVDDPAVLQRPPLLVRVSNSPSVVRPHSGLQAADHVWEHVVEGYALTRLVAVYLGQTPEYSGSARSGRPPDFELVPMYEGIYFASGFSSNRWAPDTPPRMRELMLAAPWRSRNFSAEFGYGPPYSVRLPREGVALEHTMFAVPAELWRLAAENNIGPSTTLAPGLAFDPAPPPGGSPTSEALIDYPGIGPANVWRYDQVSGGWLHWVDGEPHGDVLTGQQINFTNVVVLYADHSLTDWIEDEASQLYAVAITLTGEGRAVLLRDGQRYEVTWRRDAPNRMIQFFDASGQVIPFKPGNTWFQVVSTGPYPPEVTFSP
ncbi:MAG: hypothetical protein Kow00124_09610 [Anaerolineae bacterium]